MPMDHDLYKEFGYASERWLLMEIIHELRAIRRELAHPSTPTQIIFKELTMNPTEAGQTQVFTGTTTPAGAAFPAGTTFTISSNDPAVSPTLDSTGLIVSVTYPAGWVENPATPLAFSWATSTFTPEPSTSPSSLTANITPSAPPVVTPTPVGVTFAQTT